MHLPSWLLDGLAHYGGFALFILLALGIVGLPIPDEAILTFTGVLLAHGQLPIWSVLLGAWSGAYCGITLSYGIGRTAGSLLVKKYGKYLGFTEARLAQVHMWFAKVGKWALFLGYFIMGIRHFTGYVAGTAKLEFNQFALFAYSGATVWVLVFLSLGYFFSANWEALFTTLSHYLLAITLGLAAVFLLYGLWYWVRSYKKRQQQRSKD